MKKLFSIIAMLVLLSSCIAIDSKYTGRSRMRIYNDFNRGYYYFASPLPVPQGWVFFHPKYFGGVYWRGSVHPGQNKNAIVIRGHISKVQITEVREK